jgi:cyclase
MTSFEVIPAIDLRGGRVVRLTQGDDARRTVYGEEPEAALEEFAAAGARWVHVVDLDAAFGEPPQAEVVARLAAAARRLGVLIQSGGGLRDRGAVGRVLEAGCGRAVVGSLLARDPEAFAALAVEFSGRIVPALDVEGGEVRVEGWRRGAGAPLEALAEVVAGAGCPAVLVTAVERDGTLGGPDLALTARVAELARTPALVSGGVRSLADLEAARDTPGLAGAIVGRALYEGTIDLAAAVRAVEAASATPGRGERAAEVRRPGGGPAGSGERSGLAARVIPCLDVAGGRVVKGVRFRDLRDIGDPAEAALEYAGQGADEIVFLDITAAPERRATDLDWVRRTAERVFVPLTVGGGVRSEADARALLTAGADKVGVNTAAAERPELLGELARRFGRQCVVLSVDARRRAPADGGGWEVVVAGGRRPIGRDALAWILEGVERGAGEVLLTSIDGDGTGEGYDLELIAAAARAVSVPVIASGGAGSPEHLAAALDAGAAAVLAASIFHDGVWTVGEVKTALAAAGHRMREAPP